MKAWLHNLNAQALLPHLLARILLKIKAWKLKKVEANESLKGYKQRSSWWDTMWNDGLKGNLSKSLNCQMNVSFNIKCSNSILSLQFHYLICCRKKLWNIAFQSPPTVQLLHIEPKTWGAFSYPKISEFYLKYSSSTNSTWKEKRPLFKYKSPIQHMDQQNPRTNGWLQKAQSQEGLFGLSSHKCAGANFQRGEKWTPISLAIC